jgi:hypothetical protein
LRVKPQLKLKLERLMSRLLYSWSFFFLGLRPCKPYTCVFLLLYIKKER